jgi:hypothetical protein
MALCRFSNAKKAVRVAKERIKDPPPRIKRTPVFTGHGTFSWDKPGSHGAEADLQVSA